MLNFNTELINKRPKNYIRLLLTLTAVIFYVGPLIIDTADGAFESIWFLYLIPPVLLTINYGYKGGIFASLLGLILQLGLETYQFLFKIEHYDIFSFFVIVIVAFGMTFVTLGYSILLRRLELMSKHLEFVADHDSLTNLGNRRAFQRELLRILERVKINGKKLALFSCDLDNFKTINDTMGHMIGDSVLKLSTKELENNIGQSGSVFRLGGDEFIILLEFENIQEVQEVAEEILQSFEKPIILDNQKELNVTTSIGIAVYPDHGLDTVTLLRRADIAVYKAKEQGRNSYFLFDVQLEERITQRTSLERSLKDALKVQEFELYYQPQIELETENIIGAEALIRWIHPEKGIIPPSEFILLAEETGLIVPMGQWILRNAIQEAAKWHESGHILKVAVNFSALQLQQNDCIKNIQRILAEENFNPQYLEIEITESVALISPLDIFDKLNELRELGIKIAIDDFGTGYSSFDYLKKYPVNSIKIDRTFIQHMTRQARDKSMINAMMFMIRNLECLVVAEGVETSEQLRLLKEFRCDIAQGYYFSKPIPAVEFMNLLSGNRRNHAD